MIIRLWQRTFGGPSVVADVDWHEGAFSLPNSHPLICALDLEGGVDLLTVASTDELVWAVQAVSWTPSKDDPAGTAYITATPWLRLLKQALTRDEFLTDGQTL